MLCLLKNSPETALGKINRKKPFQCQYCIYGFSLGVSKNKRNRLYLRGIVILRLEYAYTHVKCVMCICLDKFT